MMKYDPMGECGSLYLLWRLQLMDPVKKHVLFTEAKIK
jgi:hypothetical protein